MDQGPVSRSSLLIRFSMLTSCEVGQCEARLFGEAERPEEGKTGLMACLMLRGVRF